MRPDHDARILALAPRKAVRLFDEQAAFDARIGADLDIAADGLDAAADVRGVERDAAVDVRALPATSAPCASAIWPFTASTVRATRAPWPSSMPPLTVSTESTVTLSPSSMPPLTVETFCALPPLSTRMPPLTVESSPACWSALDVDRAVDLVDVDAARVCGEGEDERKGGGEGGGDGTWRLQGRTPMLRVIGAFDADAALRGLSTAGATVQWPRRGRSASIGGTEISLRNRLMARPKPVLLLILDGWGHREDSTHNAIAKANAPNWRRLLAANIRTRWSRRTANHVGLPDGQMGNSEVGHMNIGSGRIVYQDLTRIDAAIRDGSFFDNAALVGACDAAKKSGGTLHVFGPHVAGRRAQPRGPHLRDARSRRAARRFAHRSACVPRRPRHAAAERARVARKTRSRNAPRSGRAASPASADATTRWIATSAGIASSSLTTRSRMANRRCTPRARSLRSISPTRAARTTSSSSRPSSATARRSPTAMRSCS